MDKKNDLTINKSDEIVIFSDSKSALESISHKQSSLRPNILIDILVLLTNIERKVTLTWIPAHVNLLGNEIADKLAKSALTHNNIDIALKFEAREIYTYVEKYIVKEWQKEWDDNTKTPNLYKSMENKVSREIKHNENNRKHQVLITRLRLGACGLNGHLFKIGCHVDGSCDTCKNKTETIQHYLMECPQSNVPKALKIKCAELKLPFEIKNCLSNKILTKTIAQNNTKTEI